MPKYKNKSQKKPYSASQSRIHNAKEKVLTSNTNKESSTETNKESSTETTELKCGQCNDNVRGVVQCECCLQWYCCKCSEIPDEALTIIEDFDSLHWYCQPCDIEVSKVVNCGQLTRSSIAQNSEVAIGQQIEALQSQLTGLMTKVNDHINVRFQQLEEKLTTRPASVGDTATFLTTQTSPTTEIMATRVIDEYRDRESHKLNIILHNVPESPAVESSVRITHDTKFVTDIAKSINAGPTDVVNITRLGKKLEGRTRLIKVQLGNLNQKRKILSNAKKLKECSGTLQKVYVTPDLSVNERQENKRLREELLKRKSDGEKDIIIRRGKIIKISAASSVSSAMDTVQSKTTKDQSG